MNVSSGVLYLRMLSSVVGIGLICPLVVLSSAGPAAHGQPHVVIQVSWPSPELNLHPFVAVLTGTDRVFLQRFDCRSSDLSNLRSHNSLPGCTDL